ncbi:MAG: beta-ketoacyl-ACP synthase II [Planctomycetes bacterium]|nr:beta-ketoacyl-ACP synthase II [Planctomycetota bacterium]
MDSPRRVVITGLGGVTPLGSDIPSFWARLLAGTSAAGPITRFDTSAYPVTFAAQVRDFDPLAHFDPKTVRHLDRCTQYAVVAARSAARDAGLDLSREDRSRFGAIIGTGVGGAETIVEQALVMAQRGPRRVTPFFIPMMMPNAVAGEVSIDLSLEGPSYAPTSACASSNHAMALAFDSIRSGESDAVFTGGAEAGVMTISLAGFCSARALSTRNDAPEKASRPFDRDRDGFLLGEGAGVLVFEELGRARARSARVYAEVLGHGQSADAYHVTAPHPEGRGALRAMTLALARAGVTPDQVSYVNAHGTSTDLNDRIESLAIRALFGRAADRVPVNSTKSMIGHALGAAGAIELIVCCLSIAHQTVHLTLNHENPGEGCDLDYVKGESRQARVDVVLSNSFGFGGHNCSIVLRRFAG